MKFKFALIMLPLIIFAADASLAATVSIKGNSKDRVQGKCGGDGDVFWVQGKSGHTYGCMHGDGSGIVCSGVTAAQRKTCDTFMLAPKPLPFPTREEAGKLTVH